MPFDSASTDSESFSDGRSPWGTPADPYLFQILDDQPILQY